MWIPKLCSRPCRSAESRVWGFRLRVCGSVDLFKVQFLDIEPPHLESIESPKDACCRDMGSFCCFILLGLGVGG